MFAADHGEYLLTLDIYFERGAPKIALPVFRATAGEVIPVDAPATSPAGEKLWDAIRNRRPCLLTLQRMHLFCSQSDTALIWTFVFVVQC